MTRSCPPPSLIVTAGGSGGHIFPALAVADALKVNHPRARLLFVGSEDSGLGEQECRRRGYAFQSLRVGKLKGRSWLDRALTVTTLPASLRRALSIVDTFNADIVLGAGGFVSGPLVLAAAFRGKKTVLLEQNAIPGLTNRILSKFATKIITAYPGAAAHLRRRRVIELGNPLRQELVSALGERSRRRPGTTERFDQAPARSLLVLGGSQGAHAINEAMIRALPALAKAAPNLHIVHQSGVLDRDRVAAAYRANGISAEVHAFIHEMVRAYVAADLVVARAGATTLAELALAALPAILIPYPYAADGHQHANAKFFVEAGAARSRDQQTLGEDELATDILVLLNDPEQLDLLSKRARALSRPHAASDAALLIEEIFRGHKREYPSGKR